MENVTLKGKFSNFVLSDTKRKTTTRFFMGLGILFIIISYFGGRNSYQFIMGLGSSLFMGTLIGSYVGNKVGWPLGLWIGLIGGLIIAPLVALLFGDSVSAYYASFLGPVVGALIGRWTELKDERKLKEDIDKIGK